MPFPFTCPHCGHRTDVDERYVGQSGPCAGCGNTVTIAASPASPFKKPMSTGPDLAPQKRTRSTLLVLLAVVCMCACGGPIAIALLLPAVQSAREAARRAQCSNNLKQLALAFHNYHDTYNCLPAGFIADDDGKPMHSWRIAILPFIEESRLYEQYNFDEPWDSANNLLIAEQMPEVFGCPSAPTSGPGKNLTNYLAILSDADKNPRDSLFSGNQWTKFSDVRDGLSNTILVVEANTAVPWTKPDADLHFETMPFDVNGPLNGPFDGLAASLGSYHPGGANVAMADGAVRWMSRGTNSETIKRLIQPSDGKRIDF